MIYRFFNYVLFKITGLCLRSCINSLNFHPRTVNTIDNFLKFVCRVFLFQYSLVDPATFSGGSDSVKIIIQQDWNRVHISQLKIKMVQVRSGSIQTVGSVFGQTRKVSKVLKYSFGSKISLALRFYEPFFLIVHTKLLLYNN